MDLDIGEPTVGGQFPHPVAQRPRRHPQSPSGFGLGLAWIDLAAGKGILPCMAPHAGRLPPFPAMNALSKPLIDASSTKDDPQAIYALYGQAAALAEDRPAAEIIETLVAGVASHLKTIARNT